MRPLPQPTQEDLMTDFPSSGAVGEPSPPEPPAPATDAPGPWRRVVRTVKQVLVAVPTAWLALTASGVDVSPRLSALIAGVAGAALILVSAAQNGWDNRHGNG
jgi:hypothetical protein